MLVHPQFDPVAIQLGPLAVRWYGLMYLAGFALAMWLGRRRIAARPDLGWKLRDLDDMIFWSVLGVVLGGRLGHVLFYGAGYYLAHPLEVFAVWQGGMSFHGGLLGVITALVLFARSRGRPWMAVTDFIAPLVPPGLGAGRLGNFINGELWGRPTDLPWGMVFAHADALPRHPSQIYELALEGVALFAILWLWSAKPRPLGAVSGLFLVGYGCFRSLVEFVREPDGWVEFAGLSLTIGQALSLPMVLAGAAMMAWAYRAKLRG